MVKFVPLTCARMREDRGRTRTGESWASLSAKDYEKKKLSI